MASSRHDEEARLAALERYRIIDSPEDPAFDRITDLATRIFRVPVSTITFVDADRVWYKSHFGVEVQEASRPSAPSQLTIQSDSVTVIPDVLQHPHFQGRPVTIGGLRARFYAGAPLITPDGYRIGSLSILDTRPRAGLTPDEADMLADLAAMVMDELKLQLELVRIRDTTRSLQESEARFRALMESASQAIIGVNRAGVIVLVNRKAEELFGYMREEMVGQQLEILLPKALRDAHVRDRANYFERPRARPMGIGLELKGRKSDGSEFPVEISLNHLELGGEAMAISFVTDISERTKLEQQLRQSQKMEAVGQLAGGVAHDFNNLLTVISGYSHLALGSIPPGGPLREAIEEITSAADRAAALTQQLLAFSRKQVIQPRVFNLNERVTQVHRILRRLIGEDITLELALGKDIGEIRADPGQIDQVIINLAVNARDAMPEGGRLVIETAAMDVSEPYAANHLSVQPGPHVMLAISDTGTGMTPDVQARIFEPFFSTKGPGKGTGLGLATVYGIVKQVGGSIFVYSEPGRGSTFKLLFPRVQEAGVQQAADAVEAPGGAETILLVEDEDAVRKLTRQMLESRGYRVVEAAQAEEAVAAVRNGAHPDMVLTDVVMPKTSGPELVANLRQIRPGLKALYMSGYTDRSVPLDDEDAAFIQKPFTPNQLGQKIRDILGHSQEQANSSRE